MNCPVCESEQLKMSDRQGIEIDYCAKCRGVWLDRGELDKIVERSSQQAAPARRKTRAGATPKNPPRFRNPANPSQTWSGRGRRPQWIKDAEANGTPLEAMAI